MNDAKPQKKKPSAKLPPPPLAHMIAGLVLPGAGHVLQKRYGHAAIFAFCVYGLFILGEGLANVSAIDPDNHPIYFMLQMLSGLPAWVLHFGGLENEALIGENVAVRMHGLGTSFCAIAGVLNLLAMLELALHSKQRLVQAEAKPAEAEEESEA